MNKKTIYIVLFAILYLCVGLVSTIHAVSFFGLANSPVLGTILAITFEIGQAAVLFNLLTSPKQRKKFMPWALMCILTLVQILGNIFSSYKYIVTNSPENLKYFKEPIFIWTDIPDDMATVIVTYIVGAILPIVALCLTEMVTSYLYEEDTKEQNDLTKFDNIEAQQIETEIEEQIETTTETPTTESPTVEPTTKEPVTEIPVEQTTTEIPTTESPTVEPTTKETITEEPTTETPVIEEDNPVEFENKRQSHFINL